jgi:GxxExxY protein
MIFDEGLRLDVLVEELIICELKAVDEMNPVWKALILGHLRLTGKRLGFLFRFNVLLIKNGINRNLLKPLWRGALVAELLHSYDLQDV